ncbi:MAG: hypothetical protein Q9227_009089 [Pyrenula ochraceoflavens]
MNDEYHIQMLLGKKQAEFDPVFELGSGVSWVPVWSGGGYDKQGQDMHSSVPDMSITYVSGPHETGQVWLDQVHIKGRADDGKAVWINPYNEFGVVDTPQKAEQNISHAVLGFSYQPKSGRPDKQAGFFETLISTGAVKDREIAIYLPPASNSLEVAQLTLGGRDKSRYTGTVASVPVEKQGNWGFRFDDILAGDGTHLKLDDSFRHGVVDTTNKYGLSAPLTPAIYWHQQIPGASLDTVNGKKLTGPDTQLGAYKNGSGIAGLHYEQVQSATFAIPCNLPQAHVPIILFGGQKLAMSVEDLLERNVSGFAAGMCKSRLQFFGGNPLSRLWLFGQPWMRSFYTILDWGADTQEKEVGSRATVGFAPVGPYKAYDFPDS